MRSDGDRLSGGFAWPDFRYCAGLMADSVPAMSGPALARDNPFTRSKAGLAGMVFLLGMVLLCLGSLPWTTGRVAAASEEVRSQTRRFAAGNPAEGRLPPWWAPPADAETIRRLNALVPEEHVQRIAAAHGLTPGALREQISGPA
jgi:hypothetical protein